MESIVVLLFSIAGSLIGSCFGICLLYRKLRPITGAELDLTRGKLRSAEFSLSTTTAKLEEREQQLTAAEGRARNAEEQIAALHRDLAEQDGKAQDATKAVAETARQQIAGFEARIDADDRQIQELSGQVSRLTAELDRMKSDYAQESSGRTTLEAQLSTEFENSRRLASRIAELESERSHFDLTLQEERQSAAKSIELLLLAHENLSRVFRPIPTAPAKPVSNHREADEPILAVAATSEV